MEKTKPDIADLFVNALNRNVKAAQQKEAEADGSHVIGKEEKRLPKATTTEPPPEQTS